MDGLGLQEKQTLFANHREALTTTALNAGMSLIDAESVLWRVEQTLHEVEANDDTEFVAALHRTVESIASHFEQFSLWYTDHQQFVLKFIKKLLKQKNFKADDLSALAEDLAAETWQAVLGKIDMWDGVCLPTTFIGGFCNIVVQRTVSKTFNNKKQFMANVKDGKACDFEILSAEELASMRAEREL